MTRPRIMFYVQYLEGIGHVVRASRIVEELCQIGCEVTLVLGGKPLPSLNAGGASVHQLPPLSASPNSYSKLLKPDGTPADEIYKSARRDQLLGIFDTVQPQALITEAYPMGRWAMDFELRPLLERADQSTPRPLIIASLRDILQMPKSDEKWQRSVRLFAEFYDHMLIHGDSTLVRVEESFPPIANLLAHAHYTGMVAPKAVHRQPPTENVEAFDVIVSGGGGAIGYGVLAAASAAKPLTVLRDARWLALAGPLMDDAAYAKLQVLADATGVQLERYRSNLQTVMHEAKLSIQRAGYNTVADLLIARCRGVLVPDSADNQREQPLRAEKLAKLGRATVVSEAHLTPVTMAAGIDQAMAQQLTSVNFDLNGATRSAEILVELLKAADRT